MSSNSEEKGSGGGGNNSGGGDKAPRLLTGGYASWKTKADNWLDTKGAMGVHLRAMEPAAWTARRAKADQYRAEAEARSEALADGLKEEESKLSEATVAARKEQMQRVELSNRIYGLLYGCLPEELLLQVAHIEKGFAYGLWHWLETKFQSTEADNVDSLLSDWQDLRMDEDASFDAYRARVNTVKALLDHAKVKVDPRAYSFTLLQKLTPRFKIAVLALKGNGMLKDAENVDWETVTAFINSHERAEMRLDSAEASGSAMALQSGRGYSKPAWSKDGPKKQ